MIRIKSPLLPSAWVATACLWLTPSLPTFAESAALEEVVVTARRRAENLQETPVAVSAIGGDLIDQLGFTAVGDVETLTPNLQFSQTNYKAPAVFIRGIGQRSGNPVLDPGVGMYLNGVYVPRSDAQLLDAVDVANIQVLRGPQGTLFGKNNIGGAILVDSRKPDAEAFSFGAKVTLGSYERQHLKLDANVPLLEDALGLRLAYTRARSDGYIDNVRSDDNLFDENREALSARATWFINEDVELDLFGFVSSIDERGSPYNCRFQNPDAILTQGFYRGDAGSDLKTACDESTALEKSFKVSQTPGHAVYEIDNRMLGITLRAPLFEVLDVELITSYAEQDNLATSGDSDGTGIESVAVGSQAGKDVFAGSDTKAPVEDRWQFTQEIKFDGSAFDDRLSYTFGVFYAEERINNNLDGTLVGDNGLVAVGPMSAGVLPPGVPVPNDQFVLPVNANTAASATYKNLTTAVFAQASWDVLEWLQLTLGVRYTEEERESAHTMYIADFLEYGNRLNAQIGVNPGVLVPVVHYQDGIYSPVPISQYYAYDAPEVPLVAQPVLRGNTKFDQITPAFTVNAIAPDDLLDSLGLDSLIAYFSYSEGFKSGGLDVRNTQTTSNIQEFSPELVNNTELGIKLDALDSRLRFNMAVFQMDYTDLQVALYEPGATSTEVIQFTGNAGEAVVDGFEFELSLLLGNFTVHANAGYTDGDLIEYDLGTNTPDGFQIVDRSGEAFPQVPQNVRGVLMQYDWESPVGQIIPQLQYYYSDEIFIASDYLGANYDSSTISQYETYDARLLWKPSDALSLTASVSNIKDDHYFVGGIAVTSVIGVANRVPGAPRRWGLELAYKFN